MDHRHGADLPCPLIARRETLVIVKNPSLYGFCCRHAVVAAHVAQRAPFHQLFEDPLGEFSRGGRGRPAVRAGRKGQFDWSWWSSPFWGWIGSTSSFPMRRCVAWRAPAQAGNFVLRRRYGLSSQCADSVAAACRLCSPRNDRPRVLSGGPQRKNPPRISADGSWARQLTLIKTPCLTGPVKR